MPDDGLLGSGGAVNPLKGALPPPPALECGSRDWQLNKKKENRFIYKSLQNQYNT